jgi:hypothetical protein
MILKVKYLLSQTVAMEYCKKTSLMYSSSWVVIAPWNSPDLFLPVILSYMEHVVLGLY